MLIMWVTDYRKSANPFVCITVASGRFWLGQDAATSTGSGDSVLDMTMTSNERSSIATRMPSARRRPSSMLDGTIWEIHLVKSFDSAGTTRGTKELSAAQIYVVILSVFYYLRSIVWR